VRALCTAHLSLSLKTSDAFKAPRLSCSEIFPSRRFRTYDPDIGNDAFINFASTGNINAKNPPQRAGFLHWCAIVCDYRTNFYEEYKQLGYELENITNSKLKNIAIYKVA
jgi:hypothetical protein